MSINGRLTPLAINAQAELLKNSGFCISSVAIQYQGTWLPTSYTPGTVTETTVLKKLTESIPRFCQAAASGDLNPEIFRNLTRIGNGVCPALGNSRPTTFQPSYAGYGTWKHGSVDSFGNFTPNLSDPLSLVYNNYPPENYPVSKSNSYIYSTYSKLGYISSWPDRASWQNSTDNYRAVLEPEVGDYIGEYDQYFSQGFIATVARQAYYEFWYNYETRRINQYSEFINFVQQSYQFMSQKNETIATFVNSKTYLKGNFSNINDLTTSDISGVSLAFKAFGNDCIKLGKAIDLSQIHRFGTPSVLLLTLQNYNAITDAVKLAFLYNNLTTTELNDILESTYTPSPEQEKKIYNSFKLIGGDDLKSVLITINCSTDGLTTLADLLDPKAMFPNSYPSLTIPKYSVNTTSSKIYDFIYVNGGVNSRIENWGDDYLEGILPADLVIACGAFMMTMNQIKNIRQMDFEKVSQVIANLEVTSKDLPDLNAIVTSPINTQLANETTNLIALGSGNSGMYRMCDFLGSMSGYPYRNYFENVIKLLKESETVELRNVYEKLAQKSLFNDWALISGGNGWSSPNPELTYTLFVTKSDALAGATTVTTQHNVTSLLPDSVEISFTSNGSTVYTVTSTSTDGENTYINFSPALSSDLSAGTKIYVAEPTYNTSVQDLIDAANSEISRINGLNVNGVRALNYWWNLIGKQLFTEQRAIPYAIPDNRTVYEETNPQNFAIFLQSLQTYSQETEYCGTAPILEAIFDNTTLGGQSMTGIMRETRNSQRLANTFGENDDDIEPTLNSQQASAEVSAVDSNGAITEITVTFAGYGYDEANPPEVTIGPFGGVFGGSGFGASARAIVSDGMIIGIEIIDAGQDYIDPATSGPYPVEIDPPPQPLRLGDATEPGSFAGSPYTDQDPIPDNLIAPDSASYTVEEAIDLVTQCNCDCWDM